MEIIRIKIIFRQAVLPEKKLKKVSKKFQNGYYFRLFQQITHRNIHKR